MRAITRHIEVDNTTAAVEKRTARQTILDFVKSDQPGIKVNFSKNTMTKAAEDIYTAFGQTCPVHVIERKGETFLINRKHMNNGIS